jgi:hypothetical protein
MLLSVIDSGPHAKFPSTMREAMCAFSPLSLRELRSTASTGISSLRRNFWRRSIDTFVSMKLVTMLGKMVRGCLSTLNTAAKENVRVK